MSRRIGLPLATVAEVLPADIEAGRGCEVDRRLGAALNRDGRDQLGEGNAQTPDAAIVSAEGARNEAGVQAIRRDPGPLEASREFAGEQNIGKL